MNNENTEQSTQKKSDLAEVGALWLKKSNSGTSYLKGKVFNSDKTSTCEVMIFKNEYKNQDSHPDYRIYVDTKKGSSTLPILTPSTTAAKKPVSKKPVQPTAPDLVEQEAEEEIPF